MQAWLLDSYVSFSPPWESVYWCSTQRARSLRFWSHPWLDLLFEWGLRRWFWNRHREGSFYTNHQRQFSWVPSLPGCWHHWRVGPLLLNLRSDTHIFLWQLDHWCATHSGSLSLCRSLGLFWRTTTMASGLGSPFQERCTCQLHIEIFWVSVLVVVS